MPNFGIQYGVNITYCRQNHIDPGSVYTFIHEQLHNFGWTSSAEYFNWEIHDANRKQTNRRLLRLRNNVENRFGHGIWKLLQSYEIIADYDMLA